MCSYQAVSGPWFPPSVVTRCVIPLGIEEALRVTFRDLKELRWRSRNPRLPDTVLDAVTLKINCPLPQAYRNFLCKRDGGRLVNVGIRYGGKEWLIEGLYPVAEATDRGLKLQKAGKLPEGFVPLAFTPDKSNAENKGPPLVFLEVETGKIYFRSSPRAKFDDPEAVFPIAKDFQAFLNQLASGRYTELAPLGSKAAKKAKPEPAAPNPWGVPAKSSSSSNGKAKTATKKKAAKKKTAKKKATKKKAAKKKATKKKATKKKATKKKAAKKKSRR